MFNFFIQLRHFGVIDRIGEYFFMIFDFIFFSFFGELEKENFLFFLFLNLKSSTMQSSD